MASYRTAWRDAAIVWATQHAVIAALVVLVQAWVLGFSHRAVSWRTFLYPFSIYDGEWYLRIARSGYAILPSGAFFPLYPALVRLLGGTLAAELVLSNLFGLFAFGLFRILIEREADVPTARRALVYLALFPTAMFFMAGYTESLFLTFALVTMLALRTERWALAGTAALLATLTRSPGVLLLIPIAIEGWRALRWRAVWVALPALVGLAAWEIGLSLHYHRFNAQSAAMNYHEWGRRLDWPWYGIVSDLRALGHTSVTAQFQATRDLIFAVGWVVLCALMWRRLPRSYVLFAWAGATLALLMPLHLSAGFELFSVPRYMLVCFPIYWLLARWGKRGLAHLAIVCGLLLLSLVLAVGFALGGAIT
ncbi:MAG TPA: mannosyltransferase family protein [Ktedonobacterales bacterium]